MLKGLLDCVDYKLSEKLQHEVQFVRTQDTEVVLCTIRNVST